jgi:hypothetical protein
MSDTRYSLSFTAAAFRLNDFSKFAEFYVDAPAIIKTVDVDADKVLGSGMQKTNKRIAAELVKRYNTLTAAQRKLMIDGDFDEKKQICYLAIAKTYRFIREFIVEIVREKALLYDFQLSDADFSVFINRKTPLHPELEEFTDKTMYKVRQTLFKILADADIIDSTRTKQVKPQWVSSKVQEVIVDDNPEWLKIFLISDSEIEQK